MNTLITFAGALLSAGVLLTASPAFADPAYDQYSRVVLGDTSIPAPAEPAVDQDGFVPGPYAQYLMSIGTSRDAAVVAAARIGEQQVYRAAAMNTAQQVLTPEQAYARHLGNDDFGDTVEAVAVTGGVPRPR